MAASVDVVAVAVVDVSVDVQKRRQTLSIFAKSATIQKVQRPQRKMQKSNKKKRSRRWGGCEREDGAEIRAMGRWVERQEEDGHYEITFNYSYCTATTPKARKRKLQKCMLYLERAWKGEGRESGKWEIEAA